MSFSYKKEIYKDFDSSDDDSPYSKKYKDN